MARQDVLNPPGHAGDYWKLLAARPVSVPIVAARDANGPAGFLALSVSHVSANPPSMMVAVGKSTSALATIVNSGSFSINYLPEDAAETADIFGGRGGVDGAARFGEGEWTSLATGAPIFHRSPLAFDCSLESTFDFHETVIVVGVIKASAMDSDRPPLLSYRGRYTGMPAGSS